MRCDFVDDAEADMGSCGSNGASLLQCLQRLDLIRSCRFARTVCQGHRMGLWVWLHVTSFRSGGRATWSSSSSSSSAAITAPAAAEGLLCVPSPSFALDNCAAGACATCPPPSSPREKKSSMGPDVRLLLAAFPCCCCDAGAAAASFSCARSCCTSSSICWKWGGLGVSVQTARVSACWNAPL